MADVYRCSGCQIAAFDSAESRFKPGGELLVGVSGDQRAACAIGVNGLRQRQPDPRG